MSLPRMLRVRQHFNCPKVEDIPGEVAKQMAGLGLQQTIRPGDTVAITAGSRGIANLSTIIRATVDALRSHGAEPFIVPAMGSHGGGTAEGQQAIIEGYGITSSAMDAEIRSSMETVIVDRTPQGIPVHFDKHAFEADHVLVCGRVKPHTNFVGPIESGLYKMMLIGLGKHNGAKIYHRAIQDHSFLEIIRAVGDVVLKKCNVLGGLAIVENADDETGCLAAVAPQDFFEREQELLTLAKSWMPRIPFEDVDLLIVDRIGKNISGSGMDTNVVGRKYNDHAATDADSVRCKRILVRGLTPETHGNACGIGLAEFTTDELAHEIDPVSTRINCVTGGHPTAGAVPLTLATDREAVETALQTVGLVEPADARVIQIADTLHLGEVLVSETYAEQVQQRSDLELLAGPFDFPLDETGRMQDVLESEPAAAH